MIVYNHVESFENVLPCFDLISMNFSEDTDIFVLTTWNVSSKSLVEVLCYDEQCRLEAPGSVYKNDTFSNGCRSVDELTFVSIDGTVSGIITVSLVLKLRFCCDAVFKDWISFLVHLWDHERNGQTGKSMKRACTSNLHEPHQKKNHSLRWYFSHNA